MLKVRKIILIIVIVLCNYAYASGQDKPAIAVMKLDARNIPKEYADIVADFIREELVNSNKFRVLERENMEKILQEQKFQLSGCTTQECAVKAGRLLNVQQMVVGSLSKLGEKYYISIRLVNIEDGTIIMAETEECLSPDALKGSAEILGAKLAGISFISRPSERIISPEEKDTLKSVLKSLYISKNYYKKQLKASWLATGFGLLLGINGMIFFRNEDRLVFTILGGGLSAVGTVSLVKNFTEIKKIDQKINVTVLRINLSF